MSTKSSTPKVTSAAQLKKRAVHEGVTLPSGAVVSVRIPNLEKMIAADNIPNDLIEVAVEQHGEKYADLSMAEKQELIRKTWSFVEFIVPLTLVDPQITSADVAELDPRDVVMLTDFAARRDDVDAVGHQLGGLETQKSFRKHRGWVDFDETLAGLS